jgi:hypothetical protein
VGRHKYINTHGFGIVTNVTLDLSASENRFDRLASLKPDNPAFQVEVKKIKEEALKLQELAGPGGAGVLSIEGGEGQIHWTVDSLEGYGQISGCRAGGGTFYGPKQPHLVQGGTFDLYLPDDGTGNATLYLYTGSQLVATYHGTGYQYGLKTYYGAPWKGNWS